MATNLVKCATCNIVINEVLAFVNNKIQVMDEESISRICVSAFSDADIVAAKNLLFASIPKTKKKTQRKGDGKTRRDIDDIIRLLKETDPENIPVFVARDLEKLPPVLFDHVDVTRILKDLLRMQQDINCIKENYVTVDQLDTVKRDLKSLNENVIKSKQNNFGGSVNKKRGACLLNSFEHCSGPMGLLPECDAASTVIDVPCDTGNKAAPNVNSILLGKNKSMDDVVRVGEWKVSKECDTGHTASPNVNSDVFGKKKSMADVVRVGEWKKHKEDTEWTVVQRRRLRNRFAANRGKAISSPNSMFKAADIKIPIYIYNVAKDVPVCDILSYIASKSDVAVHVEKMTMKLPKQYDAYKILVPKEYLEMFLNDDFWPEGVAYRRFVNFKTKPNGTSG